MLALDCHLHMFASHLSGTTIIRVNGILMVKSIWIDTRWVELYVQFSEPQYLDLVHEFLQSVDTMASTEWDDSEMEYLEEGRNEHWRQYYFYVTPQWDYGVDESCLFWNMSLAFLGQSTKLLRLAMLCIVWTSVAEGRPNKVDWSRGDLLALTPDDQWSSTLSWNFPFDASRRVDLPVSRVHDVTFDIQVELKNKGSSYLPFLSALEVAMVRDWPPFSQPYIYLYRSI